MKKRFFGEEKRRYQSVGTWVRKGSATMEYIILIAVGALFAGLLYLAMSDGEGLIQSAMEKKVQEIIQGQLPEGEVPSGNNSGISGSSGIGNAPEIGDPGEIGGNPEIGASPDAGIPPELEGPSAGSGTTPADGNPEADGTSPSTTGGGSGSADGNASASSSPSESEEKGGLSGWWEKTKNYVASGQILKDAAHIGKETLDFLILDDVSGCFTGKDTDGNQLAGWERGLSCVSLVPAAKWVKLGKYADEALTFAGKLDDKLASTRLGEGMQTAKDKVEDLFRRGKEVACGCDDNVGKFHTPKLIGNRGYIDPKQVRFTHDEISPRFRDGRSIYKLIEDLKSSKVKPDDIPPIRVFERNGKIYTLDNRRLYVFQQAGVKIRWVKADPNTVKRELKWKWTTKNDGKSVKVRKGKNNTVKNDGSWKGRGKNK